ncbi:hypothetical protein EDC91_11257 [Shewanella fodinae]|uniref:Uncharacterized protein n=1 Tax=Shewanella fodinae TaxID=552357 RepID=A0A4R2FFY2_9GAMM|nr:hypothetical protein EDC91_11257 [Shewanella fodinae]
MPFSCSLHINSLSPKCIQAAKWTADRRINKRLETKPATRVGGNEFEHGIYRHKELPCLANRSDTACSAGSIILWGKRFVRLAAWRQSKYRSLAFSVSTAFWYFYSMTLCSPSLFCLHCRYHLGELLSAYLSLIPISQCLSLSAY